MDTLLTPIAFNCRFCNSRSACESIVSSEVTYNTGFHFRYDKCESCQSLIIRNAPHDIAKFYPNDYAPHSADLSNLPTRYINVNKFYYYLRHCPKFLVHFFPIESVLIEINRRRIEESARILDIGCGSGRLVALLRLIGFHQAIGLDPYAKEASLRSGFIRKCSLHEFEGSYDVVVLNHVIEHTDNPFKVLCKVRDLLATDGIIILRCPLANSYAFRKFRGYWIQLDPPRHQSIPSIDGLRTVVKAAGLDILTTQFDSTEFQILGSKDQLKGISLRDASSVYSGTLFSKLRLSFLKLYYFPFVSYLNYKGRGDQVVLILGKGNRG